VSLVSKDLGWSYIAGPEGISLVVLEYIFVSGNEFLTGGWRIVAIALFCETDVGVEWSVEDMVLVEALAWIMVESC